MIKEQPPGCFLFLHTKQDSSISNKPGGFSEVRPVCAWYSKTVCRATRTEYRQSPPGVTL